MQSNQMLDPMDPYDYFLDKPFLMNESPAMKRGKSNGNLGAKKTPSRIANLFDIN